MAKPTKTKKGVYSLRVSFAYKRAKLTLGRIRKPQANQFAANIEELVDFRSRNKSGLPDSLTSWVAQLSSRHREQLGELGLLDRFNPSMTVGELIDFFLDDYDLRPADEVADSTKTSFRSSMENRIPKRLKVLRVRDLEPQKKSIGLNAEPVFSQETKSIIRDVESWQRNHYAKSSWSRANGRIREVGKWAIAQGIIDHNPFSLLPKPGETNKERNVEVKTEWVLDAMDYSRDPDTRLSFVLGRFSGFRTPSEARTLKPSHIDFENSILEIFDSKKKVFRRMPLFNRVADELRLHKSQVKWDRFVMSERYRKNADSDNFNKMKAAIAKTEHSLWPKLRQNLRSSLENDLLEQGVDERLVTLWLGHTIEVSRNYYQKQRDHQLTAFASQIDI